MTVSAVSLEIFDFFPQICLLSSPPCCIRLLSKSLNLIGWRGDIKGKFSRKKNSKFFFSETVRRMKLKIGILALDIPLYKNYDFNSGQITTLVAMATYCFHRLITGRVEIGNFFCFIVDNRILFLQKCLLNSSPHFIRLLTELLNLIGCRGKIKSYFRNKSVSQEP